MSKNEEIIIHPDANKLFHFAAKDFNARAIRAVNEKGFFSVVLSGGNTPKLFYDVLTTHEHYRNEIPWAKIYFFFGDERYVPADSPENNYHMSRINLFSKLPIASNNIFPIPTDYKDPEMAAHTYAQVIKYHLPFDLVYLGLGEDAHTASLMPLSQVVKNSVENKEDRLVASLYLSKAKMFRLTMTPKAINQNGDIIFMVSGAKKAAAVKEVLQGKSDPLHFPAQLIHSNNGRTLWFLDKKAGELL